MGENIPGCVTKCDRGRGSKLAKNGVTYFMDGPLRLVDILIQLPSNKVSIVETNVSNVSAFG